MSFNFGSSVFNSFNNVSVSGTNSSIDEINGTLFINGVEYPTLPKGSSLKIDNSGVYVDGKLIDITSSNSSSISKSSNNTFKSSPIVNIEIKGNTGAINASGYVSVSGDVNGNVCAGTYVKCNSVHQSVSAGTSATVGKGVGGSVSCGTSVTAGGHINGSVSCGTSSKCCA